MVHRTINIAMHNKMVYIDAIPEQDGPTRPAASLRAASIKGHENGQDGRKNR
jgi:hypothetical protein